MFKFVTEGIGLFMTEAIANTDKHPLILIVDDEPLLRSFLARQLRQAGYSVHVEESGNKAVAFMKKTEPDLVISDIRMADGDGLMVLKTTKKRNRDLPVLMISGFTDIPEHEFFHLGAVCLLHKPFETEALLERVRKNLLPAPERIDVCKSIGKVNFEMKFLSSLEESVKESIFFPGAGGFTLFSSRLYGKGQTLNFSLTFKEETLKGEGLVQWVKKTEDHLPYQLGVEVKSMESESQARWLEIIELFKPVSYLPGPS